MHYDWKELKNKDEGIEWGFRDRDDRGLISNVCAYENAFCQVHFRVVSMLAPYKH
jgi:hypothetical protein